MTNHDGAARTHLAMMITALILLSILGSAILIAMMAGPFRR